MSALLVVTDLDGSLLDHDDYSFEPARPVLEKLAARRIPVVLASSKTRAEMLPLQRTLGLSGPFICENGAAIVDGEQVDALAPPREQVLAVLTKLREQGGYAFTGFADLSPADIAELTGLDEAAASLAAQREYSEPLLWEDSDARLADFREALENAGLVAQQGGRFLSVAGPCDKGQALKRLRVRYGDATVIALGDSPNDEAMLAAADIAVIIRSARSDSVRPGGVRRILRTRARGPEGWQEALSALLAEYE